MPYVQMQDFRLGMDRKRKLRAAGELGSAWTIKNAHLTRGGDIDRRKKFVKQSGTFPDTTFGLFAINETLYSVGYDAGQAGNLPSGVSHITTTHPTPSTPITKILDASPFDGQLYSISQFDDGNIYHFYDDDRVTDWDTLASDIGSNTAVASALAAAIDQSPTVGATSSTNVITITGEEDDDDFDISVETTNFGSNSDQSLTVAVTQAAGVSQPKIVTVTVGGTFETSDRFTVTIATTEEYVVTGGSAGTGNSVLTFKKKLYSTASSNWYFSALNAPTQWISGVDYGFINMASEIGGDEVLTGAEEYQGLAAIFSKNNIRIWSISEDSSANVFLQTIRNSGTSAPAAIVPYGNNDLFYLALSGIRSLKARDSSNSGYVSDVGTAIDTHIREYMDTLTQTQRDEACGVIEPIDGRLWMAVGKRIYVLSFFSAARISAWSYYELDFQITHFAKVGERIYVRGREDNGDENLYLYGGTNNQEYPAADEDIVTIELPFITARDPAGAKMLQGFDIIAINEWEVKFLPDPSDEAVEVDHGVAVGTTYGEPRFGTTGYGPMFGVTLTCSAAGQATLSALAMHYHDTDESG